MVWMCISDQQNYPNLRALARSDLPHMSDKTKIWSAFKKYGELNDFSAFQAVSWIDGSPLLNIKPLNGMNGSFQTDEPNTVNLDQEIAERFENDFALRKAQRLVEATVLHELVHWGEHRDGIDQPGEEGKAFEREAYGGDVDRYWVTPRGRLNFHEGDTNATRRNQPRGIRNNNPGNIKIGAEWDGLAKKKKMTPEQRAEETFCVFKHPKWGIRAMGVILKNYQKRHELRTITGMISRWAPPSDDNDTASYISLVTNRMEIGADQPFAFKRRMDLAKRMAEAMIFMENGVQPYTDALIEEGLGLANIG